jgi:hypothetical protein
VSRLLVVDASVVRAAGETEHPVSKACRDCLTAIRDICHRVAVTPELHEELRRHMSRFSRKWRISMAARRKPLVAIEPATVSIDLTACTATDRDAIEKDLHLLGAARAADSVVVTLDTSLKSALAGQPDGRALLQSLVWIDPVADGVAALEALRDRRQRPGSARRT